jgi:AP-4 complex subunit mu-1
MLSYSRQAMVTLRLFSDLPADKSASGLEVEVPLPPSVQRCHCEADTRLGPQQSWEFSEKNHMLVWRLKKLAGRMLWIEAGF